MTSLGLSIDDDDKGLGDDDDLTLKEFYSSQCGRARITAGDEMVFVGPHVSDTLAGERWRRRRESVPGVGPLAN